MPATKKIMAMKMT